MDNPFFVLKICIKFSTNPLGFSPASVYNKRRYKKMKQDVFYV